MQQARILVTSAAGRTGSAVVHDLLRRGERVRAIVRRVDHRSEALQAAGAEVIVADLFDASSIHRALVDVQRVYFAPPWHPYMLDSAAAVATAIDGSSVESLVWMSQWLADAGHPSPATRQHALIDRLLSSTREVAHTIVNPGYFADNYLRVIDFASLLGVFPSPTGASRNAPPSNEDIARVVAAALLDPAAHDGRSYRPTGPALLSAADMAAALATTLGRSVRHWDLPEAMFLKATRVYKVNPIEQLNVIHYLEEHRLGTFEFGAPNDDVATVTGTPAEAFETTAARYAQLPFARPTPVNRARMLARFMRIGVTATPNADRQARRLGIPRLADPTLAFHSPAWRTAHLTDTHHPHEDTSNHD